MIAYLINETEFIAAENQSQALKIWEQMTGEPTAVDPDFSIREADLGMNWICESEPEKKQTLGEAVAAYPMPGYMGSTDN